MIKILKNKKNILSFLTVIISLIFIGKAFQNLLNHGSDFKSSFEFAKLFWDGVDIYDSETRETLIHKNSFYPHLWYIILYPIINVEFYYAKIIFFILNLLFFFGSIIILKSNFNLNSHQTKILIILSVTSTPFTNLIAIGNLSLFSLFFILIFYFYKSFFLKGLALSLALIKYNMSFLFVIYSIIFKQYKVVFVFLLLNIFSALFYFYYLDINNFFKVFDPFLSLLNTINEQIDDGINGINFGLFNIHNFLIWIKLDDFYFYILLTFILIFIYLIKFSINSKEQIFIFLLFGIATLVYHMIYDYVLLIPVLAYVLKNKKNFKFFYLYLFSIIYVFYIFKINTLFNFVIPKEIFSLIGMVFLFLSNYLITFKEMKKDK